MKGIFSRWRHVMYHVNLDRESGTVDVYHRNNDISDANVVSSEIEGSPLHTLMVDLDVPAHLIPSETPGHSHLFIDVPMTADQMWAIVDALAAAGVVEGGYAGSSHARGFTSVRLPWVAKGPELPVPTGTDDAAQYRASNRGSGENAEADSLPDQLIWSDVGSLPQPVRVSVRTTDPTGMVSDWAEVRHIVQAGDTITFNPGTIHMDLAEGGAISRGEITVGPVPVSAEVRNVIVGNGGY